MSEVKNTNEIDKTDEKPQLSTGAIVGIVLGVLIFVIIICSVIYLYYHSKKIKDNFYSNIQNKNLQFTNHISKQQRNLQQGINNAKLEARTTIFSRFNKFWRL